MCTYFCGILILAELEVMQVCYFMIMQVCLKTMYFDRESDICGKSILHK